MNDDKITLDEIITFLKRFRDLAKSYLKYYLLQRIVSTLKFVVFFIFEMLLMLGFTSGFLMFISFLLIKYVQPITSVVLTAVIYLASFFLILKLCNWWIKVFMDRISEKLYLDMMQKKHLFRGYPR